MSMATTFEARIGSSTNGAGRFIVGDSLSEYALQSLVDSVSSTATSVILRLVGVAGGELAETSRAVRAKLAPLERRGIAISVVCVSRDELPATAAR